MGVRGIIADYALKERKSGEWNQSTIPQEAMECRLCSHPKMQKHGEMPNRH